MKISERDNLLELQKILSKMPFPSDGMGAKTASMLGHIQYAEDMHALVPMVQQALMGMVTLDNIRRYPEIASDYEEGWDYHDPSLTLQAIDKWIELRVSQKWENANRYELKRIYDEMRAIR